MQSKKKKNERREREREISLHKPDHNGYIKKLSLGFLMVGFYMPKVWLKPSLALKKERERKDPKKLTHHFQNIEEVVPTLNN